MKKQILFFLVSALLCIFLLSSCDTGNDIYSNITADSNAYSAGVQTIRITASDPNGDEPTVSFRSEISAADIVLGDALEGKTVSKVTYISNSAIEIELSGSAKAKGSDTALGSITVKHSGLESDGSSVCHVHVLAPEIRCESVMSSKAAKDGKTTCKITATLRLIGGEFTPDAAGSIRLADGVEGTLTAKKDGNDVILIEITDATEASPVIVVGADATPFAGEVTFAVSAFSGAKFE